MINIKKLKAVIFIFIFIVLWHYIFSFMWYEKTTVGNFYNEPDNSLDVLYFGASNAYTHFNTVLAYNEYGLKTGMLSTDSQPLIAVKYLIEESRKTQNPQVYVIDISSSYDMVFEEGNIRKITDFMKNSKNKFELLNELLNHSNIPKKDYVNYYFSFLKYHSIWKNLNEDNFNNHKLYKGFLFYEYTSTTKQFEKVAWDNNQKEEMSPSVKEALLDLLDYIKDNNLNVLFVISPRIFDEEQVGLLNSNIELIKSYDFKVLNLNNLDIIDYNNDFYNKEHLNVFGSTKFTLYLGNYLALYYDLENHNKELYNSWQSEYERFKISFKDITKQDFDLYLNKVKSYMKQEKD